MSTHRVVTFPSLTGSLLIVATLALIPTFACSSDGVRQNPNGDGLPLDRIHLPQGFRIGVYAYPVPGARSMALSDAGTLFVGT
ncbi:MAG TPA: sorbosone dehydrogenase family protein, partial [Candidatus Eisenbacteria bacterium]|nr:sorbosone dehydrogenase family protein [Candidatus Eisenbacteria bacterium]